MFLGRVASFFLLSAMVLTSPVAARQDDVVAPEQINSAIGRGIDNLYAARTNNLLWEQVSFNDRVPARRPGVDGGQWGGLTALATYTLLAAGENPQREELASAVEFLRHAPIEGVYALGMRAQVWLHLPRSPLYQEAMRRDWQLLGEAIQGNDAVTRRSANMNDSNIGLFDYTAAESARVDLSVSQFGVLGLWAADRYGAEVPATYWQAIDNAWLRWQQPDGGWAYNGQPRWNDENASAQKPTTLSMTAAGVATLFITQDYLHVNDGMRCHGNVHNPAIGRGLEFIGEGLPYLLGNIAADTDLIRIQSNATRETYYTLYGIERIGVASGLKYISGVDWYAEGAKFLLDRQNDDGGWGSTQDTCFALLFLLRGREPIFMNKLAYAQTSGNRRIVGPWNQRPRDVANLARYLRNVDERKVNWQTIDFNFFETVEQAVRELHDAPITYLGGSNALRFTDDEKAALKSYVESGGMLLANADCGSRAFADSFVQLGEELFKDRGYEFRLLEDSHPIHTDQKTNLSNIRRKPKLLGLSNGVREMMLLVESEDLGRDWQLFDRSREEAFQIGTNIYLYAVDKQRQGYKGETHLVQIDPAITADKALRLARIQYEGNWNPEPAGWGRLAAILHNERKMDLVMEAIDIEVQSLDGFDVAHLTGTNAVSLSDKATDKLKRFVIAGGTLVIDAAGGDSMFAASVERMLQEVFGDEARALSSPVPVTHPIYSLPGDEPLRSVDYRLFARKTLGDQRSPRLRAITIDGRAAVILSNEDLSNGMVGHPVGGVFGYAPADASRLMTAILLYAHDK